MMYHKNLLVIGALALMFLAPKPAQAQTFTVLHNFSSGQDGANPAAGLTLDSAGNLYGTAQHGGDTDNCTPGCGTAFKLTHAGSGWVLNRLYSFVGGPYDGAVPQAAMIFGPDGALYGTTLLGDWQGGGNCQPKGHYGCGVVYKLRPPARACKTALCPWTETLLYQFTGSGDDGGNPGFGSLIFDVEGNLYGATFGGLNVGAVYELSPSSDGWTGKLLHRFVGSDGGVPEAGLAWDAAGNLYGTTEEGGSGDCRVGCGVVYQLTPTGPDWILTSIYKFQNNGDGAIPASGLIFDAAGNLYGATTEGGQLGGGVVFELTPANGNWTFHLLANLPGPGIGPFGNLTFDDAGNLYGLALTDGAYAKGSLFKLSPGNGGWTYTSLHDFTGRSDGGIPYGNVIFDANGNLYGTASVGGTNGYGVVWEMTP